MQRYAGKVFGHNLFSVFISVKMKMYSLLISLTGLLRRTRNLDLHLKGKQIN